MTFSIARPSFRQPIIWLALVLLFPLVARAQQELPPPPPLAAKSWVLYDYTGKRTLVDQNGNERIEPASLTKLMTAYLAFSALRDGKLTEGQSIMPSADAVRADDGESRMFLQQSKAVSVDELLHGLIIQSANDAALVLAETIAGSEEAFVDTMNSEAQRLGMSNTHFANPSGLPHAQHYSTANDLARLAAAIVNDFPQYYALYSQHEYRYNGINQFNRNRLLWLDPYVDGLKTGHTESAGYCLVASAKRNKRRLISVVIGTASDSLRASESQKLLNYGFQYYETVRLYQRNQPIASLRVWKGTEHEVGIGFRSDLLLTVPSGQSGQLKATLETQQPLIAPILPGQQIGILKLTLGGAPYAEYPLVALEGVPLANVLSRGWDHLRLMLQ